MVALDLLAEKFPAAAALAAGDRLVSAADYRPALAAGQVSDGVRVGLGLALARACPDRLQISCRSPERETAIRSN